MRELALEFKDFAHSAGFPLFGVAAATSPPRLESFHKWLDSGFHGQMHYLEDRRKAYAHPDHVLEGCRTIVMLGMPYSGAVDDSTEQDRTGSQPTESAPPTPDAQSGKVARYAWGNRDYHDVIHEKLKQLKRWLLTHRPDALVRGIVDTAPFLEREFAEIAGLGWVGKNTLLLNRNWGSYFFLASILTDIDFPPDESTTAHCGTCTACLDACPTSAFEAPYVLDARRCISYLTIEHRESIAPNLREQFDGWLFGCDVCQEVCPWNRRLPRTLHASQAAPVVEPDSTFRQMSLLEILALDEEEFRSQFRRTPFWRPRRRGMLRNAILLAGASQIRAAVPMLNRLLEDAEPTLRAAACWALARIGESGWRSTLAEVSKNETEPAVLQELARALSEKDGNECGSS